MKKRIWFWWGEAGYRRIAYTKPKHHAYIEYVRVDRVDLYGSRFAACGGSAAAWKNLALRLAEEANVVIENAHWKVRYGSGNLRNTILEVEQLAASEARRAPAPSEFSPEAIQQRRNKDYAGCDT